MLPTTPSDLTMLSPWMAKDRQRDLRESQARSQQICEEATAVRAMSAEIMQETAQLRSSARQVRAVHAQHLAAEVRRRQKGLAR